MRVSLVFKTPLLYHFKPKGQTPWDDKSLVCFLQKSSDISPLQYIYCTSHISL